MTDTSPTSRSPFRISTHRNALLLRVGTRDLLTHTPAHPAIQLLPYTYHIKEYHGNYNIRITHHRPVPLRPPSLGADNHINLSPLNISTTQHGDATAIHCSIDPSFLGTAPHATRAAAAHPTQCTHTAQSAAASTSATATSAAASTSATAQSAASTSATATSSCPTHYCIAITLDSTAAEEIYGGGIQFSRINLKGKELPIWSREQGVGRSIDPISIYAALAHRARGAWHTTYAPLPHFICSSWWLCKVDSGAYIVLDFKNPRRIVLRIYDHRATIYLQQSTSYNSAVRALSHLAGRQPPLPDWVWDGMWLGLQGGHDTLINKLACARRHNLKVGALWAQDWCGTRTTAFGKQVMWNWRADEQHYPRLRDTIARLQEQRINFLGYINPFVAMDADMYAHAQDKGYFVQKRSAEDSATAAAHRTAAPTPPGTVTQHTTTHTPPNTQHTTTHTPPGTAAHRTAAPTPPGTVTQHTTTHTPPGTVTHTPPGTPAPMPPGTAAQHTTTHTPAGTVTPPPTTAHRTTIDYPIEVTTFPAALLDLTNPEAVAWYQHIITTNIIDIGIKGWMADFGEYLPTDAHLHNGISAFAYHNQYITDWAALNQHAIAQSGRPDLLFFMRAAAAGAPAYVPLYWSGDQNIDWSYHDGYPSSIFAALSAGSSGIGMIHSDIGGYTALGWKRRHKSTLLRWAELALCSPIMRTHEGNRPAINHQYDSDLYTLRHFARLSHLHSTLKPYHQHVQAEYQQYGLPAIRPPQLHYPYRTRTRTRTRTYMYGGDCIVFTPSHPRSTSVTCHLPDDHWHHLWSTRAYGRGTHRISIPIGYPAIFYRHSSPFAPLFATLKDISV